ncbi:MAG: hypothetical protein N4J56_001041 [Chroococcidiopsis sp. SAG 2025]|nr:hypothetical protein [Chroococcidiopsis sp. SAG 2025]
MKIFTDRKSQLTALRLPQVAQLSFHLLTAYYRLIPNFFPDSSLLAPRPYLFELKYLC